MQTMICCISNGHKVYESIRMGIGQGPPMHTLHIFERKWTLRFCNVSDDPRVKKKGDNLRGSLDVVTNVEAFEGGAGSASWGHDLALLRLLQVSTAHFTSYSGTFVLLRVLLSNTWYSCLVLWDTILVQYFQGAKHQCAQVFPNNLHQC